MTLRRIFPILLPLVAAALLAVAAMASGRGRVPTSRGQQEREEKSAPHGGWVERFHGQAGAAALGCLLPPGVTLRGNWTHGDYVSSWATWIARAPAASVEGAAVGSVSEAAHSSCGKPLQTMKPPAHAKSKAPKASGN